MKLYCKSYGVYTVKGFIGYLFSLSKSATQSVLMVLTLNGLFQKNSQVFYFTPENPISHICLFFFNYSVCTVISDCNHPFDTSIFTQSLTRIHLLQLKIHIWMEFFWNQKFLFFHKRNFNPKVKLFLIKLSADIS